MAIYLGLGSNQGDRRALLERALTAMARAGINVGRVSPVVESPALLADGAPPHWNVPFLNIVAECAYAGRPEDLLIAVKRIEVELGRVAAERWSPRPIDIDVLLWDDESISLPGLVVPHPGLRERAFVLAPLAALRPDLCLPDGARERILPLARRLAQHIPLWMGIVNITPDSFSDGGKFLTWPSVEAHIDRLVEAGAHMLDFGAESTRPGATPLAANAELARLEPVLERVLEKLSGGPLGPLVSIDTYHAEVAERALALGVDIVNDVSGLTSPAMVELAAASAADWVAMHNVSIPADPGRTLAPKPCAVEQVERWLEARLEAWSRAGLEHQRIIFDPGIGFGKNPLQSLALLRNIERFHRYDLRLLVGHSRKSFMHGFAGRDNRLRDLATIGATLKLCSKHVDILRVHNVPDHVEAHRGWSHLA